MNVVSSSSLIDSVIHGRESLRISSKSSLKSFDKVKLHYDKDASGRFFCFKVLSPTSEDVMRKMSEKDEKKYPATELAACDWKSSAADNQCLTAGQGIKFLSYDPLETKVIGIYSLNGHSTGVSPLEE